MQDNNVESKEAQTPGQPPDPAQVEKGSNKAALWVGLAVVVLAAIGGAWWYMQANKKPVVQDRTVKIGVFENLEGDGATVGMAVKQAVDLARKQLTSEGLTVEIVKYSALCDAPKAVAGVKDLAAKGVVAIIGDYCSGAMLEAAPFANELKIPMVSPSATNPKITDAGDYIFRVIPSDAFAADFTAKLLYDKGLRKLAIMHGNEAYGIGLNTALSDSFKKLGGTVVDSQSFENETTTVATQMQHIKAAKPDALYIAANSSTVAAIAIFQQLKTLGMTTPVYSSETLKDPILLKEAGALIEGLTAVAVSEGSPSFVEQHQAAYGKDPDIYGAQAYDAYAAIFKAIASGANTSTEVKDALYKVNFEGVSGLVKFDKNGDVPANYSVYKVVGGKFVPQTD